LPLATSESSKAMNHNSKASLRITSADYTAKLVLNSHARQRTGQTREPLRDGPYSLRRLQVLPASVLDQS
jgi:hypothetical protein